MTDQELFDRVARHLLRQGKKSVSNSGETCAYHGADGTKCAIGELIPDSNYDVSMEGTAVSNMYETSVKIRRAAGITDRQRVLAGDLQMVHDHFEPYQWRRMLREVAINNNLNYEVINETPNPA